MRNSYLKITRQGFQIVFNNTRIQLIYYTLVFKAVANMLANTIVLKRLNVLILKEYELRTYAIVIFYSMELVIRPLESGQTKLFYLRNGILSFDI